MNYTIDIVQQAQQARIAVEQARVAVAQAQLDVAKAQLDFLLESRVRMKAWRRPVTPRPDRGRWVEAVLAVPVIAEVGAAVTLGLTL
jgi:hypothetical protein